MIKNRDKLNQFIKGFKNFINKGNILHLAIAFIIGQLFNKLITSLSSDIIMPLINMLLYKQSNLKNWRFSLDLKKEIYINYGNFLQNIGDFLITTLIIYIFLVIFLKKNYTENQSKKKENIEELTKKQTALLEEIKNILQK